jgi:putative ABC transport system permease protein
VDLVVRRNFETVKVEPKSKTSSGVTAIYYASAISIPKENRNFFNEILDLEMYSGSFLDKSDTGKVLIGYERSLGNNYLRDTKVGDKLIINDKQFIVKGILEKKGSFTLDYSILMNEDDLDDLTDFGEDIDTIQVKMKDKDLMDKTKSDIESALRKSRNVKVGEEDFTVSTPASEQKTVNSVLNGIQIFILIIASVSVFIGAVGIINTMTTSVLERRREIGIMKSIGARNSNIFYQFFVEAGLLGLVGGIVGAIIGTLMSVIGILAINAYLGAELSPSIDFILVSASLAGSFIIGAVAGIIPAMSAAKQNPIDALRG